MNAKNDNYKVFMAENVWILTKEKIASSWLKDVFDYDWITVSFNQETQVVSIDPLHLQQNSSLEENKFNKLSNDFINDWNLLINSSELKKEFIFLIKNPIHKFITGWIQDNIMRKINDGFIDDEKLRLASHFTDFEIEQFFNYIKNIPKPDNVRNQFPDVTELPIEFKNIYEEFILPSQYDYFRRDVNDVIYDMTSGHSSQNLYMLWDMLFHNKLNIDISKIQIIDIDIQDLEYTLFKKYNIFINERSTYRHTRGIYLKNKVHNYMINQHNLINSVLSLQLFFWFEIISKVYSKEFHHKSPIFEFLKPITKCKEKFFISETDDFFKIYSHFNWYKNFVHTEPLVYTTNQN